MVEQLSNSPVNPEVLFLDFVEGLDDHAPEAVMESAMERFRDEDLAFKLLPIIAAHIYDAAEPDAKEIIDRTFESKEQYVKISMDGIAVRKGTVNNLNSGSRFRPWGRAYARREKDARRAAGKPVA